MSKLELEQEQGIIALFATDVSRFKISSNTGCDASAVRRVLRDYKRGLESLPKLRASPSTLAKIFEGLAKANDDEDIEILWPLPKVSKQIYDQLCESRVLTKEGSGNLFELRKFTETFEDLEVFEACMDDCAARWKESAQGLPDLIEDYRQHQ